MARGAPWVLATVTAAVAAIATVAAAATCTPTTGVVVVQAEAAAAGAPTDGWEAVAKVGAAGVVWRPSASEGAAADPPGQGRRTYGWTAPVAGVYRLVLRASGVRRWANHEYVLVANPLLLLFSCSALWRVDCGGGSAAVGTGGRSRI